MLKKEIILKEIKAKNLEFFLFLLARKNYDKSVMISVVVRG